jgi:glycogenin glucosyltransferase
MEDLKLKIFHIFVSASSSSEQAWVTLATNDSYALGGLVLAHSLRRVNTTKKIAIMISNGVTEAMR